MEIHAPWYIEWKSTPRGILYENPRPVVGTSTLYYENPRPRGILNENLRRFVPTY